MKILILTGQISQFLSEFYHVLQELISPGSVKFSQISRIVDFIKFCRDNFGGFGQIRDIHEVSSYENFFSLGNTHHVKSLCQICDCYLTQGPEQFWKCQSNSDNKKFKKFERIFWSVIFAEIDWLLPQDTRCKLNVLMYVQLASFVQGVLIYVLLDNVVKIKWRSLISFLKSF